MRVVIKIGSSSLTDASGAIDVGSIKRISRQVSTTVADGHEVVIVSSGAVASGMPVLGIDTDRRPTDSKTLQAISAVGQARLMQCWNEAMDSHRLIVGQVLLAPRDFMMRTQYLQARGTLDRLLELGVVPIVNENDTVADDEIRFGDNDRIAALVAHIIRADLLVILTDMPGLMDADPRLSEDASLIEEIEEVNNDLEALAGGAGSARGSGGMASKLAAAKMASWSGVRVVIAAAGRPDVLTDAIGGRPGIGTTVLARSQRLSARKLWIAFAVPAMGRIVVDDGAARALTERGRSLLAAGIVDIDGTFAADDAVEVVDNRGRLLAKGLSHYGASGVRAMAGRRSDELTEGSGEVIHRDDMVIMP
ncbi:MAG: glutamate 5-kinase [Microthrixaceae bacterium]